MDYEINSVKFTCHNFNLAETKKFRQELDRSLGDGTLTYDQLFVAICTINDGGPGDIPYSMGTEWFIKNTRGVAAVFGQATYCWFLLDCGAAVAHHFASDLAIHPEAFVVIEDLAWREAIASELYLRHGAINGRWVAAFRKFLERDRMAELLLERLELVEIEPGMSNDVHRFLHYGDRDGEWCFLTPTELVRAFQTCAAKAPIETYDAAQKLYRILSDECIAAIRQEILPFLTCDDLSEIEFSHLPFFQQIEMLRARAPFVEDDDRRASVHFVDKLVGTAFGVPEWSLADQLLREVLWGTLAKADSAVVYRNARVEAFKQLDKANRPEMPRERYDNVVNILDIWLAGRKDVFLGVVTEGRHRGQRQLQVVKDSITFVHDRNAHRYFPQVGDSVLIKPNASWQLTTTVRCVAFLPALSADDVY